MAGAVVADVAAVADVAVDVPSQEDHHEAMVVPDADTARDDDMVVVSDVVIADDEAMVMAGHPLA